MNEYKMSDLAVGMTESFSRKVTPEMMEKFYEISGDENPLHRDEEFAKEKGFENRVVYGMLTASLISTLGGVYLPGKYCLIQGVETKFLKPVFIGDELTVTGEVVDVRPELKYMEIKVTIRNQKNEKVLRGVLKAGVMDGE
ncbi:MAG: MaoC family dehydratase [Lachnospiraceae bacterium]|nr:MaoC family dehydratase [Lachnospiraceae bacterium]